MSWLAETRSKQFELTRHFLRRMFDGEWSAAPGQWKSAAIGLVSMLLPAGLLLVREGSLDPEYASRYRLLAGNAEALHAAAIADEMALVTVVMCVTGLAALLQWQSLFPSRRDYLALAALPVRSRQIFMARFAAVLLFSLVIVLSLNLLPSLIAPAEFGGSWRLDGLFLERAGAQLAASVLACWFVWFAVVALQGVLLNLAPGRLFHRASSYAQGALTGLFLLGGLYSWTIKEWNAETVSRFERFGAWLPPVWYTGWHETLTGQPPPFYAAMAARGKLAAAIATAVAIVSYLGVYRRHRKLLIESPVQMNAARSKPWLLARLLGRTPRQEAILDFLWKTLTRSRTHYLLWLVYLGAAAAVAVNSSIIDGAIFVKSKGGGWTNALKFLALFWPLACSVVLISGLRHVLSIPAELPANWLFRMTEGLGRAEWMAAVERFVMACAIAPIYLVLLPVSVFVLGWQTAARMTSMQILVSLAIFEVLFNGWQRLPFTCSYVPGRRPLALVIGIYLAALGALVPVLTVVIAAVSMFWPLYPFYFLVFAGIWLWLRRVRRDGWGEARLYYDDPADAVTDLGIRDITYAGRAAQLRAPGASASTIQAPRARAPGA